MNDPQIQGITQTTSPALAPVSGWAAPFLAKLDEELAEVEAAMIHAREDGQWMRHATLSGQRIGLCQAKHFLSETQPNEKLRDRRANNP